MQFNPLAPVIWAAVIASAVLVFLVTFSLAISLWVVDRITGKPADYRKVTRDVVTRYRSSTA